MDSVTAQDIRDSIYVPPAESHKGQNGRLLIIGGSQLFHAASLWSLTVASRIVDLVHYCSVEENNELVIRLKEEFRNGIVVKREDVEEYVKEDDCILIGPGMVRAEGSELSNNPINQLSNIQQLTSIASEGVQTKLLTDYLLKKYPEKRWVIDAGALQMVDIGLIPKNAILTPHQGELEGLWEKFKVQSSKFKSSSNIQVPNDISLEDKVKLLAKALNCIVLLKGQEDIACMGDECTSDVCVPGTCKKIEGGNAGMTKGGTGDVLAGMIAALACKSDPYAATIAGSFINKKAAEALAETVGPFFNSTDLANGIPRVMNELLG